MAFLDDTIRFSRQRSIFYSDNCRF